LTARPWPARLLLVRHGQSTWNSEHRIQGQLDPPLSDEGRRQAERLGQRIAGRRFAGFYSSDLKRAVETAQAIEAATGLQAEPMAGLREIFLGEWEGLRTDDLAVRFPEAGRAGPTSPTGTWCPVARAQRFSRRASPRRSMRFLGRHSHGDVVVVTHGGVIQIALHRVIGRPSRGLFPFKIQNASISVIERRDGRMVIGGVNDTEHLDPARVAEPGPG